MPYWSSWESAPKLCEKGRGGPKPIWRLIWTWTEDTFRTLRGASEKSALLRCRSSLAARGKSQPNDDPTARVWLSISTIICCRELQDSGLIL
jgi:hypothetical protein